MRTALIPRPAPSSLAQLVERAQHYAVDCRAASTRRAYLTDFATFEAWCAQHGLVAMPTTPATVAVYLSALADLGRRPTTIERALTGIAHAHRSHGYPWQRAHPTIVTVMAGIRRRLGVAPSQKAAVVDHELGVMLRALGKGRTALRDKAVLTLGWWGAFRRSELVSLTLRDVTRAPEGLVVTLRKSKGDQEGRGLLKGIPYATDPVFCPVRALEAWLREANITEGPLFRAIDQHGNISARALGDRAVALIVQRAAERAGLDPKRLAGHSLRSGFATTAARQGRSLDAIMRQTLHKCERVARGYIRHAKVFEGNAAIGLR